MTLTEAVREQRERDGRDDPERDGNSTGGDDDRGPDPSKPVRRAFGVVSRRPVLLFAFALAAVVVAVADVARILDPVGNATPDVIGGGVSLTVLAYPSGTRVTAVTPGALVALQPWWLLAAALLGSVGPLAAGAATTWTVARAAKREVTTERVLATTTYVLAVAVAWRASAWIVEVFPAAVAPLLLVGLWLSARLFPAPALAALGRSPVDAASEAYALTRGRAFGCFLSVLGAGTLGAVLANVGSGAAASPGDPLFAFGTVLSYTFAGAIGAVAATIYAVEAREERERGRADQRQRETAHEGGEHADTAVRGLQRRNGN
ncbi:hypothetical protein [Halorubellus sp. PRR65]|uniref:hypothetical protein n=1 Tax=Halorubellus sp. PRR65 TaxID=3098148 RepID=UPI002B25C851|nr:hypothetical protein [Halorubellus sp. PRR65]